MEVQVVFGERQGLQREGLLGRDPKKVHLACHADVLLTDDIEFQRQLLPNVVQQSTTFQISAFISVAEVAS